MNKDDVKHLLALLRTVVAQRAPDFLIGDPLDPYLRRWWLQRDPETCSLYLHEIRKDDDDRALHDHPWPSMSIILDGVLREITPEGERVYYPGDTAGRSAEAAHRLEVVEGPVWTLFVTGKRCREWGFHCANGWVHWRDFVDPNNKGAPGRGCGEPDQPNWIRHTEHHYGLWLDGKKLDYWPGKRKWMFNGKVQVGGLAEFLVARGLDAGRLPR